ncbi:MAG: hypothetical protein IME96_11640, partial [Proteobacteria bacterium]|nr:hypothetical protein [Pseudomonadota bacterium]
MIQELLAELTDYLSQTGREEDLAEAKATYFKESGGLFGDEQSYDMRIANFLEWYIFDRRLGGSTLIDDFIIAISDDEKRKAFQELGQGVRSIFEIKKVSKDSISFKDLKDGKKYVALALTGVDGFNKGAIIDARLLPQNNHLYLSSSCLFHHEGSKKFITAMIKDAYKRQELTAALTSLANMSLKWEKYRNYKAEDIY